MDTQHYLERINFHKQINVTKDVLFELQENHLLNVPFENLDIHYNKKIRLDINAIFNKIVINNRGGFCYELNGLFYHLLKKIGFDVKMISGRVYSNNGNYGEEYDHLAIIANIKEQKYLVDVGFGKFSLKPLELITEVKLSDDLGYFQFDNYDNNYLRININEDGILIPQYIFRIEERKFSEFEEMCKFHQTNKGSHFTQKKVVSILTKDGRITLNDNRIKITKGIIEEEIEFEKGEFNQKLKEYFNIEI